MWKMRSERAQRVCRTCKYELARQWIEMEATSEQKWMTKLISTISTRPWTQYVLRIANNDEGMQFPSAVGLVLGRWAKRQLSPRVEVFYNTLLDSMIGTSALCVVGKARREPKRSKRRRRNREIACTVLWSRILKCRSGFHVAVLFDVLAIFFITENARHKGSVKRVG